MVSNDKDYMREYMRKYNLERFRMKKVQTIIDKLNNIKNEYDNDTHEKKFKIEIDENGLVKMIVID